MNDPKDRGLPMHEAVVEIADPEKLSRFDTLAREFGRGRDLIALLSEPGGSSRHLWSHQYELRAQGKDASGLCSETQDLYASLINDFRSATIADRFNGRAFIGGVMHDFDPKELFGLSGLPLRLDENTIELPGGCIVFGIELRINRELECSGISDAPGEVALPPLRGNELDDALDRWALVQCGGDPTKLPDDWTRDLYGVDRTKDLCGADLTKLKSRQELLLLARKEPGFSRVTQKDIRDLRRRLAPKEITRGGGRMHARHHRRS